MYFYFHKKYLMYNYAFTPKIKVHSYTYNQNPFLLISLYIEKYICTFAYFYTVKIIHLNKFVDKKWFEVIIYPSYDGRYQEVVFSFPHSYNKAHML